MLTLERLLEVLAYDPETGIFTRKVRLAQCHQAGDRADFEVMAGGLRGYRRIAIDGKRYLAHRLAWLYTYGFWPLANIDHVNGDRGDNRIQNLRDVAQSINLENMRRPRSGNPSGLLGVSEHQGRWRSRITVGGETRYLGMFATAEEAYETYLNAKRKLHKGCTI
jgi:hypothetical protein